MTLGPQIDATLWSGSNGAGPCPAAAFASAGTSAVAMNRHDVRATATSSKAAQATQRIRSVLNRIGARTCRPRAFCLRLRLKLEGLELGGVGWSNQKTIHQLLLALRRSLRLDVSVRLLHRELSLAIGGLEHCRLDAALLDRIAHVVRPVEAHDDDVGATSRF